MITSGCEFPERNLNATWEFAGSVGRVGSQGIPRSLPDYSQVQT